MAKWDYLIEADDPLKRALGRAAEENNPQAYFRALARVRGSAITADRWDDLKQLNAQASRISNRDQAIAFANNVFSHGFAVVMQSLVHGWAQRLSVDIFTPAPDTVWISQFRRDDWTRIRHGRGSSINARILDAYDVLNFVGRVGVEIPPGMDDAVDYPNGYDPDEDVAQYRPATPAEIQRATPRFAAIPLSALPRDIKRQMNQMHQDQDG